MTLRERLTDFLVGDEKRKLQEAFNIMQRAYLDGPWELPPTELARQLQELDPYFLQDILWSQGWDIIGGIGYATDSDDERTRAINDSVRLYKYSPLAQWAIWLWTGWGLGDGVEIKPTDEKATETWEEFWGADRNAIVLADDRIHELSNWLLVKGNRYLAFYASDQDGETRVRMLDQGEITIITNPEDSCEAWFYKREWTPTGSSPKTWYYPDWETFFADDTGKEMERRWGLVVEAHSDIKADSVRADKINSGTNELGENDRAGTVVCVLHIAMNQKDEASLWGWPILTTSRAWMRAHKEFMEARLTVAKAVAMFVRRKKVKGGSRAVASVRSTIQSALTQTQFTDTNPPAASGSVEIDNEAIDTKDLPLKTGAADAKADNEMFGWMTLLGAGLLPVSAGLDTARWATALEMDKAQSMLFERYRNFWAAQFKRMVRIVLLFKERFDNMKFADKSADVSVDTFSLADFPAVAKTIGQLVRDALAPLIDNGAIEPEDARPILAELWRISLQALGVSKAQDLTSDEAFGIGQEEEPGQEEQEAITQIATIIEQNARDGVIDWENVAQWALEELRE